ncbi:MAG TPA: hypothetical protein VLE02_02020 [Nitrosarchaeum sp.]|nr:hypothetical protein [Nitrosarchaeum sp.]
MSNYISTALLSEEMLTIKEFIKEVDYEIDPFFIDRFWNNLRDDTPIYLDNALIE